ncbi:MAG: hypothetical protein IAF08_09640 [Rhizobacter sp.]|nr:hypothetical protein [Chlorobiales bacterium]
MMSEASSPARRPPPVTPYQHWVLRLMTGSMLASLYWLSYRTVRTNTVEVLSLFLLLAFFYLALMRLAKAVPQVRFLLIASVIMRASLLFSLPNLSDDFYRFVWDGRVMLSGQNPFARVPSAAIDAAAGLDETLLGELNSPDYFSVYPPLCQAVFYVACLLFPASLAGSVFVMKVFVFAAECGSLVILRRLLTSWKLPAERILIYALNPLVIIELSGNLHFEAMVIFFLLLALWLLGQVSTPHRPRLLRLPRLIIAATAFGLAVLSKLLPLMYLPFFIRRLGVKKFSMFGAAMLLISLVAFVPFWDGDMMTNIAQSLALYTKAFEFNAGFYYLVREVGLAIYGYNMIQTAGARLAAVAGSLILLLALYDAMKHRAAFGNNRFDAGFVEKWLFAGGVYLAFATTVHPWYLAPLVMFSVFSKWKFALVWSLAVPLSYAAYGALPYQENLWLVAAEYLAVLLALGYDIIRPISVGLKPTSGLPKSERG